MTMKDILNKTFGIHSPSEAIYRGIEAGLKEKEESKKPEPEEWIWVEGFKGTDHNMCCRGEQFEIGKTYTMPDDAKIETCSSGYHLCLKLRDVFGYYKVEDGNRFFKVRALVRKSDYEEYGKATSFTYHGMSFAYPFSSGNDKLAAKSITFTQELTIDEILQDYDTKDWTEEQKHRALFDGPDEVKREIKKEKKIKTLVDLGYSLPFASYISNDDSRFDRACAVGAEPELSMDVKVLSIMIDND